VIVFGGLRSPVPKWPPVCIVTALVDLTDAWSVRWSSPRSSVLIVTLGTGLYGLRRGLPHQSVARLTPDLLRSIEAGDLGG